MSGAYGIDKDAGSDVKTLVCLVGLVVLAFWPVFGNGFVNWDDPVYILHNPLYQLPIGQLTEKAFNSFPLGNYHPLTTLLQAIEFHFWGPISAQGYHVVSLLTHLLNLLMIYMLLRRLGFSCIAAGTASGIFALHPLRVEAVAWVSAQKDLWCAALVLVSLHCYLSYVQTGGKGQGRFYVGSLASFLLALFAKGTALVLPVILLLVDRAIAGEQQRQLRWKDKVPFFLLATIFGIVALAARSSFQAVLEEAPVSGNLLWLASYRLSMFLLHSLIPLWNYFPIYPPGSGEGLWKLYALLGLAMLLLAWLWFHRRLPVETAGILWFVVALIPALPLQNLGYAGDRFTYLAAAGLALTTAALVDRLLRSLPYPAWMLACLLVLGGAGMSLASSELCSSWHDSDSLISRYIELYRSNPGRATYLALAFETRGEGRRQAGHDELARSDFAAARQAWPEWVEGMIRTGEDLIGQGRLGEAVAIFDRAARLAPENARIFSGRAIAYRRQGHLTLALLDADRAVMLAPEDAVAYNSRGNILQMLHRSSDALSDFSRAIDLAPESAAPRINRGMLYFDLGKTGLALADMEAVLQIHPQDALAREWVSKLRPDENRR